MADASGYARIAWPSIACPGFALELNNIRGRSGGRGPWYAMLRAPRTPSPASALPAEAEAGAQLVFGQAVGVPPFVAQADFPTVVGARQAEAGANRGPCRR